MRHVLAVIIAGIAIRVFSPYVATIFHRAIQTVILQQSVPEEPVIGFPMTRIGHEANAIIQKMR